MVAWLVATFWLALIAPAVAADARPDAPREAQVVVDELEALTEPSDSAFATSMLRRGDRVVVLAREDGWARVEPPDDTFEWINAADIRTRDDGACQVAARRARVRFAAASARLPGPPGRTIARGTVVRLLDRPDLIVGPADDAQTWRAIEPAEGEVRYLRAEGLGPPPAAAPQPTSPPPPARPERLASFQAEATDPDVPAEVNAELTSIAATARLIRGGSVETWDLAPIRARYESLLRQYGGNPRVQAVVQPRLDQTNRAADLASKARKVAQILDQSEQRDAEVAQIQQSVNLARSQTERKFDAQGLLQASSRRYRGQKVLALIGPEGRPISYLTIPPGIAINRYLARKVGVRGIVHFDEGLGARLISVRDLEVIEKVR